LAGYVHFHTTEFHAEESIATVVTAAGEAIDEFAVAPVSFTREAVE